LLRSLSEGYRGDGKKQFKQGKRTGGSQGQNGEKLAARMGSFFVAVIEKPFLEESGVRNQRLSFPDRGVAFAAAPSSARSGKRSVGPYFRGLQVSRSLMQFLNFAFNRGNSTR
jgi:hypothetical protein